jgi:hypothetical protein
MESIEYTTPYRHGLHKFVEACKKAGIIIWVRETRRTAPTKVSYNVFTVRLENESDRDKANELAFLAGLEF